MKRLAWIFVCALLFSASACDESAAKKVDKEKVSQNAAEAPIATAAMSFSKTVHDFGTIKEGETVQTTFTFTAFTMKILTRNTYANYYIDQMDENNV